MFPWKSTSSCNSESPEQGTELDVEEIAIELQEMTNFLDEIELHLQTGVPSCPPQDVCDGVLELYGSGNKSIRKLQSNSKKLQHQMNDLFNCSKVAKSSMTDLHNSLCNLEDEITKAHHQIENIESIKLQMDLDGGRCLQRYKYLRQLCFNWNETYESANKMKRIFDGRIKLMYTKSAYHNEKGQIFKKLEETENACVSAKDGLMQEAKQLKGWVTVLLESEPLWNSMETLVTAKTTIAEYNESVPLRRLSSSLSFSSGRILSLIKQKPNSAL